MAAYAVDIVKAFGRIQGAYVRDVRLVHGYPLGGGLTDECTLRGLREIELWLSRVDKRCHSSLPRTSEFFTNKFLQMDHKRKQ
jgi:hypothetical protein